MGVVYRAEDTRLGRGVAIKLITVDCLPDENARRRFDREARAASALNHPNICTVHDVGTGDDGEPYLVLELLTGLSLRERLGRGHIPLREIIDLALPIADALETAHAAGIVHRDLKPANIFITDRGVPKLLDFGLAKIVGPPSGIGDWASETATTATAAHTVLGTLRYMSPEQVRGQPLDARSDLFSFGATLYEMATGTAPFGGGSSGEVVEKLLTREPDDTKLAACGLPAFESIVTKLLEKDRELRYQSARELKVDLRRLKESLHQRAAPVVADADSKEPRPGWRPLPITTGVTVAIVAVALAGLALWSTLRDRPEDIAGATAAASPPRVSPFVSGPTVDRQAAWSPTAGLVAYVSDAAGNDDVWICDAFGTSATNLTASFDGVDSAPAWSPDASRIAFYSERDGRGIYTMTPLGAGVRAAVRLQQVARGPVRIQWVDAGRIVYDDVDPSGNWQVHRAGVDAAPECLTCDLAGHASVRSSGLSPDGRQLAFYNAVVPSPLFVLDLGSGRVTVVADHVQYPKWAASNQLLFTSGEDGIEDLWEVTIDPATGAAMRAPIRVTSGLDVADFAVADGGRRILVTRNVGKSHLWSLPIGPSRLTLDQARRLTSGTFRDSEPRWAPDGSVVFTSNRRGGSDIWRLPAGSDTPVRLTTTDYVEKADVSPDGRWILFSPQSGPGLFVMRHDGSDVRTLEGLLTPFFAVCCADWSHDGTRVVAHFWETQSARARLGVFEFDPDTGRARDTPLVRLPSLPFNARFPRWSPDGRWLAAVADSDTGSSLWIVGSEGQGARRLTDLPTVSSGPVWQARPLTLYFQLDGTAIWRLSMNADGTAAAAATPWIELPRKSRQAFQGLSLDVNASGDQMVAAIREHDLDIWLVERTAVPAVSSAR